MYIYIVYIVYQLSLKTHFTQESQALKADS